MSGSNILEAINKLYYGERIARMCLTPRTTTELREEFEKWRSQMIIFWGQSFSEHLRQLEVANVIQFANGMWTLTKEGKNAVERYLG